MNPTSFGRTYEEQKKRPRSDFVTFLARSRRRIVWGAFHEEKLVGLVRLEAEGRGVRRYIYSMYVTPAKRGRGLARRLLKIAMTRALRVPGVKQLWLTVETTNEVALRALPLRGISRVRTGGGRDQGGREILFGICDEKICTKQEELMLGWLSRCFPNLRFFFAGIGYVLLVIGGVVWFICFPAHGVYALCRPGISARLLWGFRSSWDFRWNSFCRRTCSRRSFRFVLGSRSTGCS